MTTWRSSGVLFRVAERLYFLPANVAIKILPSSKVARVPGAPPELVGVTLVDGETMPVASVAPGLPSRGPILVCAYRAERIGLVGVEVIATGIFEGRDGEAPSWEGEPAALFDLAAAVAPLRKRRWAV